MDRAGNNDETDGTTGPAGWRVALLIAGAVLVGALSGFGLGAAFPGGGDAVVSRELPPLREAQLPRIAVSGRTGADAPLVVLDPGHGGFDPGASSTGGAREKDIALALATAVRDVLLDLGGVRVAMTREDDRFLPLEERPRIAEALGADAFVSIHADSAPVPEAQGANVYVLSARASDREAQALARIANESASGLDLPDGADDVAHVLADLMRRETALASVGLATAIDEESQGAMPRHAPFRRSANFVVLRSPEMPSVLFEAGYLTNPDDAQRLADPATRQIVAEALARAILTDLLAAQPR
ncbi:N-acetylmuramoyl-L-alanine amidase family protein [Croceicoccus sediminis]|uniref:N-acetylmuramoyl-L-alanine amidase family protein n=1 Tax=Croceicoccus sediminis TaxID=2571150 RepID=UPI0011846478|nr:N-acetylmuramoyl-L-alanine amidase [Croceicoccus sediminis]